MFNEKIYQFANIVCRFRQNEKTQSVKSWEWLLDPYKTGVLFNPQSAHIIDFLTEGTGKIIVGSTDEPLMIIGNQYFCKRITRAVDGGTIWEFFNENELILNYYVSNNWANICLQIDRTETDGNLAFAFLGQIIPYIGIKHNLITFHGVLIEYHGKGIIVSAPSGTGKTTHARMWRDKKNALIINGDRASCVKMNGVWSGFGFPWSGSSGEQINRCVTIKVIVILERGDINQAQQISNPLEAFTSLLPHVQYPPWDNEMAGRAMDLLDDFLQDIPVIRLCCRPNVEAVDVLETAIDQL